MTILVETHPHVTKAVVDGRVVVLKPEVPNTHEVDILTHLRTIDPKGLHTTPYLGKHTDDQLMFKYCPRGDLFAYIENQHQPNPQEGWYLFHRIALALQFLHRHGIAHMDIALDNILLVEGNSPRFTDFGQSMRDQHTVVGIICGKDGSRAPELNLLYHFFNPFSADIFSLGCLLFTLLTHMQLFRHTSSHDPMFHCIVEERGLAGKIQEWDYADVFPPSAVELLDHMLCWEHQGRWDIEQVILHLERYEYWTEYTPMQHFTLS